MKTEKLIKVVAVFILLSSFLYVSCGSDEYWPGSGWRDSEPEKQGMDSEILEQITQHIQEELPQTTSVLIIRNGYIIFEEYYVGDRNTQRHTWHATRSFTSALIGIAVSQGYIKNIDQKVIDYFPEFESENLNPYINDLTISHLLTMTSGFNDTATIRLNPKDMKKKLESSEHLPPGEKFSYDPNCSQLLSMIVTKATGDTLEEYGKKHLFEPLGIAHYSWEGAYGFTFGANALYLSNRDLAKFGFLYLKQGIWKDKQIVPMEWIQESIQSKVDLPKEVQSHFSKGYGYNWWIISTQNYYGYMASGRGGKYLCVVPDLNLVVVITSEDYHEESLSFLHLSILDDYIVPAVIE